MTVRITEAKESIKTVRLFVPTIAYLGLLNLGGRVALGVGLDIGVSQLIGQALAFGGSCLLLKSGKFKIGEIGKPCLKACLVALLSGVGMQVASDVLIATVGGFGGAAVSGYVFGPAGVVSSVIAAPIVEECVFRGLTQRAFQGVTSKGVAIVAQAVLFAACHTSPVQMAYSFLCALALGAIADKYGIGTSIGAHSICNALGLVPWPALL